MWGSVGVSESVCVCVCVCVCKGDRGHVRKVGSKRGKGMEGGEGRGREQGMSK